jgi:hypothetical protein
MTVSKIGVSYTPTGGSPVYSFLFKDFVDTSLPRSYIGSASFEISAGGAAVLSGPTVRERHIWAISAVLSKAEAESFDAMFKAWDNDRSNGLAAAVGIIDETFGPDVNTNAVFSTPPTYSRFSHTHMVVSFGLTEV